MSTTASDCADNAARKYGVTSISLLARRGAHGG